MRYSKDAFVIFRTNSKDKGLLKQLADDKGLNISELLRKHIKKKLRREYGKF